METQQQLVEQANNQRLLLKSILNPDQMPTASANPQKKQKNDSVLKIITGNKLILTSLILASSIGLVYLSGFGMGALAWTIGKYKNLRDELCR